MDRYLVDLKSSLRMLGRSPGLTLSAVAALAMGIGFPTAMFSIVHGGTRDLPFEQPHELVVLTQTHPRRGLMDLQAGSFDYAEWSRQLRQFEGLAAFEAHGVNLGSDDRRSERRGAANITPNALALLGERPALGRAFLPADASPGAAPVVVLGHDLWRARFDADSGILGRIIRVDGRPHTVVGVMRAGFGFPVSSDLWLPLTVNPGVQPGVDDDRISVFGRLRNRVSLDAARAELATVAARIARQYPETHGDLSARLYPFVELEMEPETARALYLMLGAVSFVLLIACANVANLLLARAATRTREMAIRTALGATRRRMVLQHLAESTVLAGLGGLLGLGIAYAAVRFFAVSTSNIIEAFWMDFRVDGTVVGFAAALVMAAGIVAGILPALRASATDVADVLKDASGGATGLRIGRVARVLVVGEMALATGFLIMTMTFTRSALALRAVALPFPDRDILAAQVGVGQETLGDPAARARFARDLSDRLRAIPGVRAAGLVSALPGRGSGEWTFALDAPPTEPASGQPTAGLAIVTPEFFDVLEAGVLRGRGLTWGDDAGAPAAAVVNQSFVRKYSSDREPLGRRIFLGQRELTIVGVVPDLQIQDVDDRAAEGVYASILQVRPYAVRLVARTGGDPLALAPTVRDAVEAVDPDLPVYEVATLRTAIYADKRVLDVFGVLFLLFGIGALFLAVLSLYAVVSFAVNRRAREIGIRVALGAAPRDVTGLVLRQGAILIGAGSAIGLLIAFGLSQALAAGIDVVEPAGVPTYLAIVGTLSGAALMGLVRPVRRALALEPAAALRAE
jgi:putative ABC transport system permease protein